MLAADVQVVTNPLHLLVSWRHRPDVSITCCSLSYPGIISDAFCVQDDMRIIPHSLGEARGAPSRAFAQETFLKVPLALLLFCMAWLFPILAPPSPPPAPFIPWFCCCA